MDLKWLPNALTVLRAGLALAVAGCVLADALSVGAARDQLITGLQQGGPVPDGFDPQRSRAALRFAADPSWAMIALGLFLLAALTDLLDGVLARTLDATSAFGAWLDPIADKLLVGITLLALALVSGSLALTIPTVMIVARDVYVTWLRARLGGGYALPVMAAAKWKTALEMVAIGLLLAAPVLADLWLGDVWRILHPGEVALTHPAYAVPWRVGVTAVWAAAGLSVWTGIAYWRAMRNGDAGPAGEFD